MAELSGSQSAPRRRAVAWVKEDPFGVEFAEIAIADDRLTAVGVAIGTRPTPYRLDYRLETGSAFVTTRLGVTSIGDGWSRELDLRRDLDGVWHAATSEEGHLDLPPAGVEVAGMEQALDCDLGLSPVTNMMPILRHNLLQRERTIEFTMAWVSVPALTVRADGQRYAHISSRPDRHVIRYEAIDGTFAADITVDGDGVVIDYPGIAQRLPVVPKGL